MTSEMPPAPTPGDDDAIPAAGPAACDPPEVAAPPGDRRRQRRRFLLVESGLATGAGLVATVTAMVVTGLYPRFWAVLWGENDAMGVYTYALNLSRGRWYLVNPDLGYPGIQDHGHFPLTDLVSLGQIGLLAQVVPPIMAVNLFTLGTWFTVAATSYLAGRYAGMTRAISLATALAFDLLPWHFTRAGSHLWLGSYMSVPLTLFLVVALTRGDFRRRWVFLLGLAAAVIVGANGVYYALMSTIMLAAVIAFGSWRSRRLVTSRRGLLVAAMIPVTVAVQVAISILSIRSRSTGATIYRATNDSLAFSGDVTSLFHPDSRTLSGQLLGHVLDLGFPTNSEGDAMYNSAAVLAIVVTCALVGLRFASARRPESGTALAAARFWPGLFLLVLGFTAHGAFGALFSRWISNEIRSWGRFSIYLAGIALLILGLGLTVWMRAPGRRNRLIASGVTAAIAVSGFVDISTGRFHRDVSAYVSRAAELEKYVGAIEARTDANCAILQLPIVEFPEVPAVNAMGEYQGFWPYLYSHDLRWSYGAFKGTEFGYWGADIKDYPELLLQRARLAGFCGIQIDTWGWGNSADGVAQLAAFGWPDVVSSSGRWLYFDLTGPTRNEYVYYPHSGFSRSDRGDHGQGQWSLANREGSIGISGVPSANVRVNLHLAAPSCGPTSVRIDGRVVELSGEVTHQVPVSLDDTGNASLAITALGGPCWQGQTQTYATLLVQDQLDIVIPAKP